MSAKQVDGWRDVLTATGRGWVLSKLRDCNPRAYENFLKQAGQIKKGRPTKAAKIEVYEGADKNGYWRVKSANGEIVAQSEGYKDGVKGATKGAKALLAAIASMASASIVKT